MNELKSLLLYFLLKLLIVVVFSCIAAWVLKMNVVIIIALILGYNIFNALISIPE